jgi:rRNA maturation endonuclease Nob1
LDAVDPQIVQVLAACVAAAAMVVLGTSKKLLELPVRRCSACRRVLGPGRRCPHCG